MGIRKRLLDLAIAVPALAISLPALLVAALAVKLTSRGPAFFVQERVGLDGELFSLYKLRTMYTDADHSEYEEFNKRELAGASAPTSDGIHKLEKDRRVTPVGRVLRRTSLDEVPQLINVIRGDMSIVGPRPSLPFEIEHFASHHHRRNDVRPGITGLWQVSGRNRLSMLEMLELDVEYVERWSLRRDLEIILKTPRALLDTSAGR